MAKEASCQRASELGKLTMDDYFNWLSQFEETDLYNAWADIANLKNGGDKTEIDEKKSPAPQSAN
jgi:hypothetical protein